MAPLLTHKKIMIINVMLLCQAEREGTGDLRNTMFFGIVAGIS